MATLKSKTFVGMGLLAMLASDRVLLAQEAVVVTAKRLTSTSLPEWVKEDVNAPLVPTPTTTERKIAPIVNRVQQLGIACAFITILITAIIENEKK
jgi:hypothetical protein